MLEKGDLFFCLLNLSAQEIVTSSDSSSDVSSDRTVISLTNLRFVSQSPFAIQSLLNLNMKLCQDVCLSLVPGKTKLLVLTPNPKEYDYCESTVALFLNGKPINPVNEAEHLGVIRSTFGSNVAAVQ